MLSFLESIFVSIYLFFLFTKLCYGSVGNGRLPGKSGVAVKIRTFDKEQRLNRDFN